MRNVFYFSTVRAAVVQRNHACFGGRGIPTRKGSNHSYGPKVGLSFEVKIPKRVGFQIGGTLNTSFSPVNSRNTHTHTQTPVLSYSFHLFKTFQPSSSNPIITSPLCHLNTPTRFPLNLLLHNAFRFESFNFPM